MFFVMLFIELKHFCTFLTMLRVGGEWRLKYERSIREIDFTKKRMQQEFEDKLEVEQQSKRQLERRVSLITLSRLMFFYIKSINKSKDLEQFSQ